jgi:hypothetical protein
VAAPRLLVALNGKSLQLHKLSVAGGYFPRCILALGRRSLDPSGKCFWRFSGQAFAADLANLPAIEAGTTVKVRSSMRKPRRLFGKAIGARSARKLVREIGGRPDHELAAEYERIVAPLARPDEEVVRLNNGRVVWISYGSANIYASADDYRALLASVEEHSHAKWQHPLGTGFSDGQAFIEAVPQLVQQLPAKLRLRASGLNRSLESLDHIDRAAAQFGGPECLDDPAILTPIVAYVGEVMREATGGRWEVRPSQGPGGEESWHPIIVGANGQEYPTFVIFKELLECGSIRARISYDVARPV